MSNTKLLIIIRLCLFFFLLGVSLLSVFLGWTDAPVFFLVFVCCVPLLISILSINVTIYPNGKHYALLTFLFLLIDIWSLTFFFMFYGGAGNPLTSLFLIPLLISTLLLSLPWTVGILTFCIGAYVLNMYVFWPLNLPQKGYYFLHQGGMFVSFLICAGFSLFIVKIFQSNLKKQEDELQRIKRDQVVDTHFTKLGIMAANSAHELNTPLSNLAMIVEGLEKNKSISEPVIISLKKQIDRCEKSIRATLKAFGQLHGESTRSISSMVESVSYQVKEMFPTAQCEFSVSMDGFIPSLVEDILVNLISNSATVSKEISCSISEVGDYVYIRIDDQGPGLNEEQKLLLAESLDRQLQFYLKDAATHRGIGLILVQYMLKQVDGTFQFPSPGVCVVSIPVNPKYQ